MGCRCAQSLRRSALERQRFSPSHPLANSAHATSGGYRASLPLLSSLCGETIPVSAISDLQTSVVRARHRISALFKSPQRRLASLFAALLASPPLRSRCRESLHRPLPPRRLFTTLLWSLSMTALTLRTISSSSLPTQPPHCTPPPPPPPPPPPLALFPSHLAPLPPLSLMPPCPSPLPTLLRALPARGGAGGRRLLPRPPRSTRTLLQHSLLLQARTLRGV